jgi:ubiquinone/menaquinone biosynthesis C-methylase UbiE
MDELSKRMEGLSAEKRKLLEQLLTRNGLSLAEGVGADPPGEQVTQALDQAPVALPAAASAEEVKAYHRAVYNQLNDQLNAAPFAQHIRFCNFGYLPDGSPQSSQVKLPEYLLNKNTVQLVLEVVGDCDLTGAAVLDVGCGRGGTVSVLMKYCRPGRVVGLDFSDSAIKFCRQNNPWEGVDFRVGDAENLPFEDREFEVVMNIESSHSYPSLTRFYAEAARVLQPGGHFLYSDIFPLADWDRNRRLLEAAGFTLAQDRNITQNVLRSCDQSSAGKRSAYHAENNPEFMSNFLGTPESYVYQGMQNGAWEYRIVKLKKGQDGSPPRAK